MIKIQALRRAFYNGEIIRAGQILTIASNKVPAWAKRIGKETPDEDAEKTQKKDEGKAPAGEQQQLNINPDEQKGEDETQTPDDAGKEETENPDDKEQPENPEEDKTETDAIVDEFVNMPEEEVAKVLDDLITKGIEAGIVLDDVDKKTPAEQVQELRKRLAEKQ